MSNSEGMLRKPDPESSSKVSTTCPFFSVLIPTMNRPRLLGAAIRTAMWQTFEDFELIVSDNSNDEECRKKNWAAIEKYADDPRVHYIRPDSWMNLPDHWEFASRHASGRYVVMLADRRVMRPSALAYLHSEIGAFPKQNKVLAWDSSCRFDERSGILANRPFTGAAEVLDSKKLASEYATFADWRSSCMSWNRLPRMLNGCYRFDVAREIREEHGRLFLPVSPDYISAFLALAYTDNFVYLDRPLFISHGSESTGQMGVVHGIEDYASTVRSVDSFEGLPMGLITVSSTIVRDLLTVKDLVGERFSGVCVDWVGYYTFNYHEIMLKERSGSPMDISALYAQLWDDVGRLTPEQQGRVKQRVKKLDRERASLIALRRLVVRLELDPLYHSVMGKIRHVRQRIAGKPLYTDVFDAALQTDHILTDAVERANGSGEASK